MFKKTKPDPPVCLTLLRCAGPEAWGEDPSQAACNALTRASLRGRGPGAPGRWRGSPKRPSPGGRARPRASDSRLGRERLASGLGAVDPKSEVALPLPGLFPGLARCLNQGPQHSGFGRKSDFGKRQGEGSKPPSLAQIYEWLLQPEKLLKPLHSMTFTLLHLIYLARRRGVGRQSLRLGGFLSTPHPLFKIRRLGTAWETALRPGRGAEGGDGFRGARRFGNGVEREDRGAGEGGKLLQLPLGSSSRENLRAGVSGNPYKRNLPSSLPPRSFLVFQPPNSRMDLMPPPSLVFGGALPSRPALWRETERTAR